MLDGINDVVAAAEVIQVSGNSTAEQLVNEILANAQNFTDVLNGTEDGIQKGIDDAAKQIRDASDKASEYVLICPLTAMTSVGIECGFVRRMRLVILFFLVTFLFLRYSWIQLPVFCVSTSGPLSVTASTRS